MSISQLCNPVIKPWLSLIGQWYTTSKTAKVLGDWTSFYNSSSTCIPGGSTGSYSPTSCVLANPSQGSFTVDTPANKFQISTLNNIDGGYNYTFGLSCTWAEAKSGSDTIITAGARQSTWTSYSETCMGSNNNLV